ncbi:OsmC family protein [uncultured Microbulbifer sp.]|uniref:OsmC family protein n=1 Tax=uncultured Microbulbifer sp. TaxID=348147 RepID=UPI0026265BEE|nr:OsmC family protein [uncultured Microbulbifer sp.]
MPNSSQDKPGAAIVRKVKALPGLSKIQVGIPDRKEGGFHFQVNLSAEATLGEGFLKTATVQANVPGCGAFELLCDEGTIIGGKDSAPAPLDYLSAGIAFCFLSHLSIYIDQTKLNIESVQVEQQMRFKAAVYKMQEVVEAPHRGICEGIDTVVFIKSDEPREVVEKMMSVCQAACMGLQTAMNAVPVKMTLVYNKP